MIDLDQVLHDVVQQACEHDFLGHPCLQRARGALQDMIGRREPQIEEVDQGGLVWHGRQHRHLAVVLRPPWCEEAPGASSNGGVRWCGHHLLPGDRGVEDVAHVVLERLCLGLGVHRLHDRHTAE
jgi:hypothetical protein